MYVQTSIRIDALRYTKVVQCYIKVFPQTCTDTCCFVCVLTADGSICITSVNTDDSI